MASSSSGYTVLDLEFAIINHQVVVRRSNYISMARYGYASGKKVSLTEFLVSSFVLI